MLVDQLLIMTTTHKFPSLVGWRTDQVLGVAACVVNEVQVLFEDDGVLLAKDDALVQHLLFQGTCTIKGNSCEYINYVVQKQKYRINV